MDGGSPLVRKSKSTDRGGQANVEVITAPKLPSTADKLDGYDAVIISDVERDPLEPLVRTHESPQMWASALAIARDLAM
jgi:uncharacterized membrane protein